MNLLDIVEKRHGNDQQQKDFILSDNRRMIITAPAGCGKTTALITKIVYNVMERKIKPYQRILCMSFSVNAALSMKKSIHKQLESLDDINARDFEKKIDVSNYHNFAMKLLYRFGYLIDDKLKQLDEFKICSDNSLKDYIKLDDAYKKLIDSFNQNLSSKNFEEFDKVFDNYNSFVKSVLIDQKIVTYNGLLTLAIELISKPRIRDFYNNYYGILAIDEFQDTNYLQYKLFINLTNIKYFYVLGDDCQKIYVFMGAMNNLFDKCLKEFNMDRIEFLSNHRINNQELLKYTSSIRNYLVNGTNNCQTYFNCNGYSNELEMCNNMLAHIKNDEGTSAVLYRINSIGDFFVGLLKQEKIDYFDGRFTDNDYEYTSFHDKCILIVNQLNTISKKDKSKILESMNEYCEKNKFVFKTSLIKLLTVCLDEMYECFPPLERKIQLLMILNAYGLKHYIDKIEAKLFVMTEHGSKGLEWDNVYIPYYNPWNVLCCCRGCERSCVSGKLPRRDMQEFLEEVSLYYVACTRARKNLYMLYSKINRFGNRDFISCLARIPNTNIIHF